jgi:peptide/nickel transport system substrate-binding protein
MARHARHRTTALGLAAACVLTSSGDALAQKQGGTLRSYIWDNPPSASIHEEATVSTVFPFMPVFNNVVLFDQAQPTGTLDTRTSPRTGSGMPHGRR